MKQSRNTENRKTILVVDNDEDITRLVEKKLGQGDAYKVISVNDSTRAIEYARKYKPDLILLDVVMKDMHGPEIALQLSYDKELGKIPVVFMTGLLEHTETGVSGKRIRGHMCLAKPITGDGLEYCVSKMSRIMEERPDAVTRH